MSYSTAFLWLLFCGLLPLLSSSHSHHHHGGQQQPMGNSGGNNGVVVELGEELLPLINHLRAQQLNFTRPLVWRPDKDPLFAATNSTTTMGAYGDQSALGQLLGRLLGATTPAIQTNSANRHLGLSQDGEVEVSVNILRSHTEAGRMLFSLLLSMWTRTIGECLQCYSVLPAQNNTTTTNQAASPQQECKVRQPEGCIFPYEMMAEEATGIWCRMELGVGSTATTTNGPPESVKVKMRCATDQDVNTQPLIKHFPYASIDAFPPVTPPPPVGPQPQQPSPVQVPPPSPAVVPPAPPTLPSTNQPPTAAPPATTASTTPASVQGNTHPPRKTHRIPFADQTFSLTLALEPHEGMELVRSINVSRAAISKQHLGLPTGARMGALVWNEELARRAFQKLNSLQNPKQRLIEVIDLQFLETLPRYANRAPTVKFTELEVELDAQNLLMWLVKQYFKLYASHRALRCSRSSCRPRCRDRVTGRKRMDCHPYELVYDRAEEIGCAAHLHKGVGPTLRGQLVCATDREIRQGEAIYKVGAPCTQCPVRGPAGCDAHMMLCMGEKALLAASSSSIAVMAAQQGTAITVRP